MVELVSVHRVNQAEVVSNRLQMRNRIRKQHARFAARLESTRRAEQLGRARRERETLSFEILLRAIFAVVLDQFRLVVEQVQVRRRTGQVQVDHLFRFGGEVRRANGQRICIVQRASPGRLIE